jgi:NADH-quinone oxidoreductase subunit G
MLAAAAAGDLDTLVVAGVGTDDLSDPTMARAALSKARFVVSLEVRASAVTEAADVVLPVAPVVEKAGSFVNWEGRVRPFPQVLEESNAISDVRALAGIAEELGRPLGFQTTEGAATELDELAGWDGARAPDPEVSGSTTDASAGSGFRLATWKPMIGDGPMQDGDPAYHASGPAPVILVSKPTLDQLGIVEGAPVAVSTAKGSVQLPVQVADLRDDVIWVPDGTAGINLGRDLGAHAGSVVELAVVQQELAPGARANGELR